MPPSCNIFTATLEIPVHCVSSYKGQRCRTLQTYSLSNHAALVFLLSVSKLALLLFSVTRWICRGIQKYILSCTRAPAVMTATHLNALIFCHGGVTAVSRSKPWHYYKKHDMQAWHHLVYIAKIFEIFPKICPLVILQTKPESIMVVGVLSKKLRSEGQDCQGNFASTKWLNGR